LQHIEDGIADLGDWVSYTPTTTGITLGNGTLAGEYTRIGDSVIFSVQFVLGNTSAVTGTISFTLPTTAVSPTWPGVGQFLDVTANYFTVLVNPTTTTGQLYAVDSSGGYAQAGIPSATIPFTWTTNDIIRLSGFYRSA